MRTPIMILAILSVSWTAFAIDIAPVSRPAKPHHPSSQNVPVAGRQGGDTIADAVPITIPDIQLTGTTAGFNDDYDEICPYPGSTSPDVVYTFTPMGDMSITIDMFGSAYDTKIFVYDQDLVLVACNDDYYPDWTSRIENLYLSDGEPYYLVIDGYEGDFGDYALNITSWWDCLLECPIGANLEGEPPIEDGYVDHFNGGCGSEPVVFSHPEGPVYCGKLGYYIAPDGWSTRDVDWHEFVYPESGEVSFTIDAEEATRVFEVEGGCENQNVVNDWIAGPCYEVSVQLTGTPGETAWLVLSSVDFWSGETYEYDYIMSFTNPVATEDHSWSSVKSLFD